LLQMGGGSLAVGIFEALIVYFGDKPMGFHPEWFKQLIFGQMFLGIICILLSRWKFEK
jgi:hypothetical protein